MLLSLHFCRDIQHVREMQPVHKNKDPSENGQVHPNQLKLILNQQTQVCI